MDEFDPEKHEIIGGGDQGRSWGGFAEDATMSTLSGVPYVGGLADEVVAGLTALSRGVFRGEPIGAGYEAQLADLRGRQTQFREDLPLVAAGTQIAGAIPGASSQLLNPLTYKKGASLIGNLAKLAGIGAVDAGVEGFTTGEGGLTNRLARAGDTAIGGAILNPIVTGGTGRILDTLSSGAESMRRSALGFTANDYKNAIKGIGKSEFDELGTNRLSTAVNRLREEGTLNKKMITDPGAFNVDFKRRLGDLNDQLESVIAKTDESFAIPRLTAEDLPGAREVIETQLTPSQESSALKKLSREFTAIEEKGYSSLQDLNKLKRKFQATASRAYKKPAKERTEKDLINIAIAHDLKKLVEDKVDEAIEVGAIPNTDLGFVRNINERMGDMLTVEPTIVKNAALDEAGDATTAARLMTRTTMGGGALGIGGSVLAGSGMPGLGLATALLGAGLGASSIPSVRYGIADALEAANQPTARGLTRRLSALLASSGTDIGEN